MTREEYDAIEAEHFSTLKHILKSPLAYKHSLTAENEETPAKSLGLGVHGMVLEPKTHKLAVWDGGRRYGKDWEAFKAANVGKEILTQEEAAKARRMADAVLSKPAVRNLMVDGSSEASVQWEHLGIACKGRMDWRGRCIWDLKTTRDVSIDAFGRECAQRLYHMQAAMYAHGNERATGERLPSYIVAVENEEPFDVIVYRVPKTAVYLGHTLYERALDRLKICRERDSWPGGDNGGAEVELSLPSWAETQAFA